MKKSFAVLMILLIAGVATAGDEMMVNGFVDASYFGNMTAGSGEFGLDQAEVDISRAMDDMMLLRVDIDFSKAGNAFAADLEQGYMNFVLPMAPMVDFTFGKFNAPIGFELLDAPDMYQYSHSLVFDNCLPTNLTGLMAGYQVNEMIGIQAYATNGWDRNQDDNGVMTLGGRVGVALDKLVLGFSGILGAMDPNQDVMRTVFDIDITFNVADNMLIGGEFNMGSESYDIQGAPDAGWTGLMVMCHYDFNEWLGLTGRFDMVDDADGVLFGTDPVNGNAYSRSSITVAPTFVLGDGLGALVEYRMDTAGEDVFVDADGALTGSRSTVAFEITYTF
ncbi:porin [bacterium]|nr:porin [bacterium]